MDKEFYKALEDQFRGSPESITNRLNNYQFIISNLKQRKNLKSLIDIGCGRGEWLEYLKANGLNCLGIDQDAAMIEHCKKNNLTAQQANALDYLKSLPDASVSMVSSFHVVEHMSFDTLSIFVKEILRVLEPSGIVLFETPNPQNIHVATCTFHLDPTHTKPIPEPFLKFLLTYVGFQSVYSLNVNHNPDIMSKGHVKLIDVFTNVSPDYAVIGAKGNLALEIDFDQINAKTNIYGLCDSYKDNIEHQIEARIEARLKPVALRVQELDVQVQHIQSLIFKLKNNWLVNGFYSFFKKIF